MNNDTLISAAGLGAATGLRSMMAPALLSQAVQTGSINLKGTSFEFLSTQRAADIATGAAVLELIGDKLPFTPDRTTAFPLIARAASGAAMGAALCMAKKKNWIPGAIIGGAAAVAAAFLGAFVRHQYPGNLAVALAEDAVAVGAGVLALRNEA